MPKSEITHRMKKVEDLFGNGTQTGENAVVRINIDIIDPHPADTFEPYQGKRLEDMVESIKMYGVVIPIIVRDMNNGRYQVLSGKNRINGSRHAGLTDVPAIVKHNISEEDAEAYVFITNLFQRSFSELPVSQRAAIISVMHSKLFSQGKRNDIINEIDKLSETYNPPDKKSNTHEVIGEIYSLSVATVARLVRINKLIPKMKQRLDRDEIAMRTGIGVSFLSDDDQSLLDEVLGETKIKLSETTADSLKEKSKESGGLTKEIITAMLTSKTDQKKFNAKIDNSLIDKFFTKNESKKEIEKTIADALVFYFGNKNSNL